jgi:glyoxylase-like metal-dependent hydrolase (beta-lactamase superfamily II)
MGAGGATMIDCWVFTNSKGSLPISIGEIPAEITEGAMPLLIDRVVAPYFESNCWILASGENQECVIVDPGIDKPDLVNAILDKVKKYNLKVVAALITHGHIDHFFSLVPLSKSVPLKAYISGQDRYLLSDPLKALMQDGATKHLIASFGTVDFKEPDEVVEVEDFGKFDVAGLSIESIAAPGHTKGSMMFLINDEQLISGDVLFAGSIGRTDLPSGSASDMRKTLKDRVLTLPDHLNVLPGHGPQTIIANERLNNPYLQREFLDY